jgi:hypothetical protein
MNTGMETFWPACPANLVYEELSVTVRNGDIKTELSIVLQDPAESGMGKEVSRVPQPLRKQRPGFSSWDSRQSPQTNLRPNTLLRSSGVDARTGEGGGGGRGGADSRTCAPRHNLPVNRRRSHAHTSRAARRPLPGPLLLPRYRQASGRCQNSALGAQQASQYSWGGHRLVPERSRDRSAPKRDGALKSCAPRLFWA